MTMCGKKIGLGFYMSLLITTWIRYICGVIVVNN